MMRRRAVRPMRPSLVGTVARTAVIAGTATAVSGKVAANQAAKAQAAAPPPAAAPAPPAAPPVAEAPAAPAAGGLTDELIEQLKKLGELRDAGILTDEEFQAKKTQLLGL
jgi:hypothetical protein